jgi:hypothetical protein
MAWRGLTVATACVIASISATTVRADDPDAQVQNAQGYDTTSQQQAAGASTTPGGGDVLPDGIAVTTAFGTDYASDDALTAAVGSVTMSMDKCPANTLGDDQRIVRVQLAKPDFETAAVVNSLLLNAAKYAWDNCPQAFVDMGTGAGTGQFHHDVSEIDIYLPDGSKGFSGTLGTNGQGDWAFAPGHEYKWEHLVDLATIQRRQAAAQAQAAQAAAAQQQAMQAQVAAQGPPRTFDDDVNGFFGAIGKVIEFLVGGALLLWVFAKREAIARWYFFTFHPHPAASLVERAIATPTTSAAQAHALADALSEVPPGSSTFRRVRLEQAEQLYRQLNEANARRQREIERRARANAANAYEEAAHYGMQEAVALAAVALERAKAAARMASTLRGERAT